MKKAFFMFIIYIFLFVCGSVYGIGEKTLALGGKSTWGIAELRTGVTEAGSVRPYPVLVLSSATSPSSAGYSAATGVLGNYAALSESALDLSLSFDEGSIGLFRDSTSNYAVTVSSELEAVDRRFARAGTGSALFGKSGAGKIVEPLVIQPRSSNALFAPGNHIRDFTLEFWLYPLNMENGEQIISWISSIPRNGDFIFQQINCVVVKNHLQWTFSNFFSSANAAAFLNINFEGRSPVVPKTWSHHLVRFDATTGMIEYLVDGRGETIVYATHTGRENSEVFTPITGNGGIFTIGARFMGLMDELKLHKAFVNRSSIQRYAPAGGRMETKAVDLGEVNSNVLKIEATGGRTSISKTKINNEFRENGRFRYPDDSEMQFFVRAGENPYSLEAVAWSSFTPGVEIPNAIRGRYVQIAVDFYPSANGESSPYLDEVRIIYMPGDPPLPPRNLTATAVDGGVQLNWKPSPDSHTEGYLVYYGSVRGEYFGKDAALGPSPIDAGKRTSILIDGLINGTLYYFMVASYDRILGGVPPGHIPYHEGEFSVEVTARPLAGLVKRE